MTSAPFRTVATLTLAAWCLSSSLSQSLRLHVETHHAEHSHAEPHAELHHESAAIGHPETGAHDHEVPESGTTALRELRLDSLTPSAPIPAAWAGFDHASSASRSMAAPRSRGQPVSPNRVVVLLI